MISYVDAKVGRIIDLLEETNQRDNTAIFFVSDHGEMLGERGMWFKQCFWEWSSHVPMLASVPGTLKGVTSSVVTSLIDLLPTIIEIGNPSNKKIEIEDLPGKSLLPFMLDSADRCTGVAISDYYHIGPCVPTRMVRENNFKLIYTHGHPHLLFDLKSDPHELHNLSENMHYKDRLNDLLTICKSGWDPDNLTMKILKSQKRRLLMKGLPGDPPEWDFIVQVGDEKRYVRKEGVDFTKSKLRIPPVATVPPDLPALDKTTIEKILNGELNHNF